LLRRQSHVFFTLALIYDAALTAAAWMACYGVRFHSGLFHYLEPRPPRAALFATLLPVVITCNLIAIGSAGLYRPPRTRSLFREWMRTVRAGLLAWLFMMAVLYYYRTIPYSRILLFVFLVVNPLALMVSRVLLRKTLRALRRQGWGVKSAAIIGTGRLGQETCHKLRNNPWLGIRVDYFVQDEDERTKSEIRGVPVRGCMSNLLECMKETPVDTAFVALPREKAGRSDEVLDTLAKLPVTLAVIPDYKHAITLNASVGELEGLPVIQLRDTPIQGWHAVAKRSIDIVGSLALLAIFGIPMIIVALLVKLTSPGPVLFKQERMGLGGRRFTILKFRSMRADAEEETGPIMTEKGDPRRTGVGAFMRRLSLDELPQLLNVLRGHMSLVGPRPERPHFVEQFVGDLPAYMLRYNVKAGLTGWAQVNGLRGQSSLRKRLQYDLYYINNWSLGFDLFILLLTPFRGIISKNAY